MKDESTSRFTLLSLRAGICLALICSVAICIHADVITVINTNDSGTGSLRQTLAVVNDGDTINFGVTDTIGSTSGELLVDMATAVFTPTTTPTATTTATATPRATPTPRPNPTPRSRPTPQGGYPKFIGSYFSDNNGLCIESQNALQGLLHSEQSRISRPFDC